MTALRENGMNLSRNVWAIALLCLFAPIVHWLALGPEIPEGTFFLISQLPGSAVGDDLSNVIYGYARPPIYALMGWLLAYPLALLLVGFLAHGMFNACVFLLALRATANVGADDGGKYALAAALAVTFMIFPIAQISGLAGHGTSLVPHDAYQYFSHRTLFWCLFCIGYLLFVRGKTAATLWIMALGCYVHPSAGILGFGLTSLAVLAISENRNRRILWHWFAAALLGAAPTLVKLAISNFPQDAGAVISYAEWYSQLIKDEADDFSILFQLLYRPGRVALIFVAIGGMLGVYARFFPGFRRDPSFWCATAIPVMFLLSGAAEYLFAVIYPTPLIHLLVALTPGYRLLSFAFFPLVVLGARLGLLGLKALLSRVHQDRGVSDAKTGARAAALAGVLIALSWGSILVPGAVNGHAASSLAYGGWAAGTGRAYGIADYLSGAAASGWNLYRTPAIYDSSAGIVTYPGERDLFRIRAMDRGQPHPTKDEQVSDGLTVASFVDIISRIRSTVPAGEGLIIPPYLRYFRDALPHHRIFFQEHHDGNLMLGSPAFLGFWTTRMTHLLGLDYEQMPFKETGLSFTVMREAYLAMSESKARDLFNLYPEFRYLLVERGHALALPRIAENESFIVHDLHELAGKTQPGAEK